MIELIKIGGSKFDELKKELIDPSPLKKYFYCYNKHYLLSQLKTKKLVLLRLCASLLSHHWGLLILKYSSRQFLSYLQTKMLGDTDQKRDYRKFNVGSNSILDLTNKFQENTFFKRKQSCLVILQALT